MPGEGCQQVVALHELLLKLWNRRFKGSQLAAQAQHVGIGHSSGLRLNFGKLDLTVLDSNELLRGFDLGPISGLGDHCVDNIGRQREIGCLFSRPRHVAFGAQTLNHSPLTAKEVKGIVNCRR